TKPHMKHLSAAASLLITDIEESSRVVARLRRATLPSGAVPSIRHYFRKARAGKGSAGVTRQNCYTACPRSWAGVSWRHGHGSARSDPDRRSRRVLPVLRLCAGGAGV